IPGRSLWSCIGPKTPPGSMVTIRIRSWRPAMPSISGPRSTVASTSVVTPLVSGAAGSSLIVRSSLSSRAQRSTFDPVGRGELHHGCLGYGTHRRLPADADVRRCARPSRRSCSIGMRSCTSRMRRPTDAPPPRGRDLELDAQATSAPSLEGVPMKTPPIVSPEAWEAARQELLVKEKELTRARDALAAERRRMPWLAVDKAYQFEGPDGMASLLDLFEGRRQLIVYRAFYGPDVTTYPESGGAYPERACVGCSFGADQVAHPAHLNARNTTLVFASRAPQAEIQGLKQRHGWEHIPWYTITDDFDKDFGVDEWHGTNAFIREGDRIFRTYFIDARGDEQMGNTWNYLDITALGRQEEWEDSPEGYPQTPPYGWWNYHDAYTEGH